MIINAHWCPCSPNIGPRWTSKFPAAACKKASSFPYISLNSSHIPTIVGYTDIIYIYIHGIFSYVVHWCKNVGKILLFVVGDWNALPGDPPTERNQFLPSEITMFSMSGVSQTGPNPAQTMWIFQKWGSTWCWWNICVAIFVGGSQVSPNLKPTGPGPRGRFSLLQ
jgi:hypothetical protein